MEKFYYLNGEQRLGPYTAEELIAQGIHQKTLIWHAGMEKWIEAAICEDLVAFMDSIPPPPPDYVHITENKKSFFQIKNFISSGFFLIALLFFTLPFVNVSCNKMKITTATGFELMLGKKIESSGGMLDQKSENQSIKSDWKIVVTAILLLIGVFLFFIKRQEALAFSALAISLMATGLLLAFGYNALYATEQAYDVTAFTGIKISVDLEIGFFLTLFSVVLCLAYNVYRLVAFRKKTE